ncbi:MAG: hypothetical protein ABIS51_08410 [Sphingomonas sp.]
MLILIALAILAAPSSADQSTRKPDAVERSTDAQDKMICKRFVDTGSLVRGTRVCKTKHEWELDRAQIRAKGPGIDSCRSRANGADC